MSKYIEYGKALNAGDEVLRWIEINLENYLKNEDENQNEIEHIIDYLLSNDSPKRLMKMSYKEANKNAEKWNSKLIKKGSKINELESDIEIIKDFNDGFKIVKLVGKNAFDREGFLMRHCVSSYFRKNTEVYSLRDSENMPHCTMERNQQIKGKGNGRISPKYISYIIAFLEEVGMVVGDNEMKNLGYVNIKSIKNKLHKDTKFINENYLSEDENLIGLDGNEFLNFEVLDIKPLIKETSSSLKINFELPKLLKASFEYMKISFDSSCTQNASSGDNTKNASSGYNAQNASSGHNAQNASSGDYAQNASIGHSAQNASSGYNAKNASSGHSAKNASSGDNAKNASSGDNAKNASSGDYAKNASSGDYAKNASSGYNAKNASSGHNAQIASSGDYAKNASSGDYAKNASSGDNAQTIATGRNSVVSSIGRFSKIKAIIGTWITLAEYDNDGKCLLVKSAQIDGEILKENVFYVLIDGNFKESKE